MLDISGVHGILPTATLTSAREDRNNYQATDSSCELQKQSFKSGHRKKDCGEKLFSSPPSVIKALYNLRKK